VTVSFVRHNPTRSGEQPNDRFSENQADYADAHESGQLRLSVAGDQRSLLPLSDAEIPQVSGATDEASPRQVPTSAEGARCESGMGGERSRLSRTIFDLPIAAWAMRGDEADHEAAQ
jgi:hypothetical protein